MPNSSSAHSGSWIDDRADDRAPPPPPRSAASATPTPARRAAATAAATWRSRRSRARAPARSPARSPATPIGQSSSLHRHDEQHRQRRLERDHRQAEQHVAVARDIDQRRLADRRGRRHDFGARAGRRAPRCRRRTRRRPAPSPPSPGMPSASATAGLRGDDPEADLADLLRDRVLVADRDVARDHRAEDRVEAGLQLRRQRGDLLRDIINADDGRRRRTGRARRCRSGASPIRPRRRRRAACCAAPSATAPAGSGCQPCGRP